VVHHSWRLAVTQGGRRRVGVGVIPCARKMWSCKSSIREGGGGGASHHLPPLKPVLD
jgi:hypothetical protein